MSAGLRGRQLSATINSPENTIHGYRIWRANLELGSLNYFEEEEEEAEVKGDLFFFYCIELKKCRFQDRL